MKKKTDIASRRNNCIIRLDACVLNRYSSIRVEVTVTELGHLKTSLYAAGDEVDLSSSFAVFTVSPLFCVLYSPMVVYVTYVLHHKLT